MSRRKMPGLHKQIRSDGSFEWKIDKRIRQYGRICESAGTSDYDEAERYLTRRPEEIRAATVYGVRPKRTFREGLPLTNKRLPYPLDWEEQKLLFSELAMHLRTMALFAVNTGLRDQELCGLEWAWEQRVPELDTPTAKRSVFLLPGTVTKNGRPRLAILNDVAQSIVEGQRGEHQKYVSRTWTFAGNARAWGRCATAAGSPRGAGPRGDTARSGARSRPRAFNGSGLMTSDTHLR